MFSSRILSILPKFSSVRFMFGSFRGVFFTDPVFFLELFIHPDKVFARVVRLLPSTLDLEFSEEFSADMCRATVPGEASDDELFCSYVKFVIILRGCRCFQDSSSKNSSQKSQMATHNEAILVSSIRIFALVQKW